MILALSTEWTPKVYKTLNDRMSAPLVTSHGKPLVII